MSANSSIEWTEHTFNPWWGCTKISPGCTHCYAETWAKRVGSKVWGDNADRRFFTEKHWADPLKWDVAARKAGVMHRVFCGSMCDIFENRMDLDTPRIRVFQLAIETPNLLWLFLTKRSDRPVQMLPREWMERWPRNVMIGFTIEDQQRLDERCEHIHLLRRQFPSSRMFASCEPLLSFLQWRSLNSDRLELFDWVIGGGESGAGARPMHPEWIRKLRYDCRTRTDMGRPWPVPFLFKQWGEWAPCEQFQPGAHPLGVITQFGTLLQGPDMVSGGDSNAEIICRSGKKLAGRVLDGATSDAIPTLPYGPQLPGVENYGACEVNRG